MHEWKVAGTDVFMINGKTLLCMVDYHSKIPIVEKVNRLSADDLVQMAKLIFAEFQMRLFQILVQISLLRNLKPSAEG